MKDQIKVYRGVPLNMNLKNFLYMDMEYKNSQSRGEHEQAKVQEVAGVCV